MQASTESMDDNAGMLGLPSTLEPEPVSRPSSTSTNGTLSQLPGLSNLAASTAPTTNSPPLRDNSFPSATSVPAAPQQPAAQPAITQLAQHPIHTGPAPTPTVVSGHQASTVPVCQNCETSTTPLWRRDEYGAVLCNACGLFLKLHGRARPISLKTDVIKSRNRVKTMRPDLATKKKQQQAAQQAAAQQQQAQAAGFSASDANGFDLNAQLGNVTSGAQRQNAHKPNGHGDTNSPGSRGGTPSLYNPAMTGFHGLDDAHFQSSALAGFSPNRSGSPLNGDRNLDTPQTHEQLIAANSALKTRVSELEVINELFRGRLGQLEHDEANARRGQEISGQAEAQLRAQLDESHRRENNLKRRLDELELELKAAKDGTGLDDSDRPSKRVRLSEQPEDGEAESAAALAVERAGEDVSITDQQSAESTAAAAAAAVAAAAAADAVAHASEAPMDDVKDETQPEPQPTPEAVVEEAPAADAESLAA